MCLRLTLKWKDFPCQFIGCSWAMWTNFLSSEHKPFLLEVEERVTINISRCVHDRVRTRPQALRLLKPYPTDFIFLNCGNNLKG